MRLLLQLSICVIVAISIPARVPAAETPAAETDDEQAIRELVARYAAARESRNDREIEALFVAEADQLVSSGARPSLALQYDSPTHGIEETPLAD